MSPLPNSDQLANIAASFVPCDNSRPHESLNADPDSDSEYATIFDSWISLDQDHALTLPATATTCHKQSVVSETTAPDVHHNGGTINGPSSVTLRDESLSHNVRDNKSSQKIPTTIVSALLQDVNDVSPPSRSILDNADDELRQVDGHDELEDVLPRFSVAQKAKWNAWDNDDITHDSRSIRDENTDFQFPDIHNSVEEWVIHNRPILQDYADRQVSLPLGRRLDVSIDEPSKFVLGALQLLANRDKSGCTDRSRKIGPQLIENFMDIDRWAREYFRSRHGMKLIDSGVSTLLTIVVNSFYEGQVQLIDRLVEFALQSMRISGRSSLNVEDFAFGFDFRMSHDLPFYVETSSRLREPLPIPATEVHSTTEPVTTTSSRQVKPSKRAQEVAAQTPKNGSARPRGKFPLEAKEKQPESNSVSSARQKKGPVQLPSGGTIPETSIVVAPLPKPTPTDADHRPIRPLKLRIPPVPPKPLPIPGNTPSQLEDASKPKASGSAPSNVSEYSSAPASNSKSRSSARLKAKLPTGVPPVAASTSSKSNGTPANTVEAPPQARITRSSGRTRPAGPCDVRGRGSETKPAVSSAKTLELAPIDSTHLLATPPAGTGSGVATTVPADALASSAGVTSRARPDHAKKNTGPPPLPRTDPGHPRRKKRKQNDSDN